MALAADDVGGKILAIFFPIMAFVAMGFDHVVANMFFIPAAIFAHVPGIGWGDAVRNRAFAGPTGICTGVACPPDSARRPRGRRRSSRRPRRRWRAGAEWPAVPAAVPSRGAGAGSPRRACELALDEGDHVGHHFIAVGLVEDLVAGARVNVLLELLAADALDRGACVHERD